MLSLLYEYIVYVSCESYTVYEYTVYDSQDRLVFSSTGRQFPTPVLVCGFDKIQIGFYSIALNSSGLDPFSGHLAVMNCSRFRVQNNRVWYEVEAREGVCGNIMRVKTRRYEPETLASAGYLSFRLLSFRPTAHISPTQTLYSSILRTTRPSLSRGVFHFTVYIPWTQTPA